MAGGSVFWTPSVAVVNAAGGVSAVRQRKSRRMAKSRRTLAVGFVNVAALLTFVGLASPAQATNTSFSCALTGRLSTAPNMPLGGWDRLVQLLKRRRRHERPKRSLLRSDR